MRRAEPTVFERRAPRPEVVDAALLHAEAACFWSEDAPTAPRPTLDRDHEADLVVVGGGFAGLWTAVRAKERAPGRRVVLLEAARLGWAASSRNGGFCDASLTHGEENGRTRWAEEYDELERLGLENLRGIEETIRTYSMDVDHERTGELSVAVEPHQVPWLREGHGRFLDTDQVRKEVDSPTYLAGLWSEETALVHPAKLVRELARVAEELGVELLEGARVTGVERDGAGTKLTITPSRPGSAGRLVVRAERVALCTNAFPALLRRFRLHTVPVWDYAVVTEPLDAAQRKSLGWANRQGLADLGNQFHYYRLTPDDRILFGGYDAVYAGSRMRAHPPTAEATYRRLTSHLLTTFPQLEGIRVAYRWGGAIDTSTRFCAFFGLGAGGRVAHAAGFTGLGVGATRFAADVLLDLLDGADTERTRLEMVRRKPVPFPPAPLAGVGIGLTRWSLDRADHRGGRRNLWLQALDRAGLGFDS